jgi:drug/metabolite transporter (DMT)-like permease
VLLGACFALISAGTFAWTNAAVRRGVLSGSVAQATTLSIPVGVPVFLIALLIIGNVGVFGEFTHRSIIVFACVGVSHFVCGRYCNYRALKAIGTNLAGPVMQFNLVVSLSLAIFFLGEKLTPMRILGILLIVLGPAIATRSKKRRPPVPEAQAAAEAAGPIPDAALPDDDDDAAAPAKSALSPDFKPRLVEGYIFAFLAALCYGASPALVRYAIDGHGVTGGLAGGVIASAGATVATALLMFVPGRFREVRAVTPEAAKWFLSSGTMVYVSQIFAYMAVSLAPVTITAPIMGMANIMRMHLSRWMNPQHEVFGPEVVLATIFAFLGVLALSASMELVPLPPAIAAFLNWKWP